MTPPVQGHNQGQFNRLGREMINSCFMHLGLERSREPSVVFRQGQFPKDYVGIFLDHLHNVSCAIISVTSFLFPQVCEKEEKRKSELEAAMAQS